MINYREIEVEEKQQVKELINIVLKKLERKEFFMPFTEEELEDMFNKNKIITYGAYDEEKLVGMAQLYFDESYTTEIRELLNMKNNKVAEFGGYLVLEEYRNKGIMKHLEDMLISKLKEINYEYAVITVHPDNIASNKATEYTGAKIIKTTNLGEYLRNIYLLKI